MSDIKPIETYYKGYRFRSRLEARWAVFFDALGIKWEYEPQGFELPNGMRYLPDFLIHDVESVHAIEWSGDIYVEVKGVPDSVSAEKVFYASNCDSWMTEDADGNKSGGRTGIPIWVVGDIPDPNDYINDMIKQRNDRCKETHKNTADSEVACALCINNFGTLDGDSCFEFSLDFTDHLILRGADSSYDFGRWSQKVSNAFAKARQARFEHGETPT